MRTKATWLLTGVLLLAVAGCVIEIDDGDDGPSNPPQVLTIRIVNNSDLTIDPEIFVSAADVGVNDLFVDGNKFTRYGFGLLGYVGAGETAELEFDCVNARTLGTRGGRFGDDVSNPDGPGRQILLSQDLNVFCGNIVTFIYSRSSGGFTTTYDVSD